MNITIPEQWNNIISLNYSENESSYTTNNAKLNYNAPLQPLYVNNIISLNFIPYPQWLIVFISNNIDINLEPKTHRYNKGRLLLFYLIKIYIYKI